MTPDLSDLKHALRDGPPGEPDAVARAAAAKFAERAAREGSADVAYAVLDSPLGALVAASTRTGLVKLAYAPEGPDPVLAGLAARLSPRLVEAPGSLAQPRRQLEEYFRGDRREFELVLDRQLMGPFTRRVLAVTAAIPYGSASTYREVAERAGSARAARAAGNALGANPIPIIIPCHRVLHSSGGLGGYGGGLQRKRWLLDLERGS